MTPQEIVTKGMYENDEFSKWLGIRLIDIFHGGCIVEMVVRKEMLNGFGIAHGGITYSLADSAFAFATNSMGKHAVSIETSISHTAKVVEGDTLTAKTSMVNQSRKFAVYHVNITNQRGRLVASFKGTVYYNGGEWESKTQD